MKRCHFTLLGLAAFSSFMFWGCTAQDEPDVLPSTTETLGVIESPKLTAIRNYLDRNVKSTRSEEMELVPIVENGDTLMFLAQYSSGWELFSNSLNAPMSLMKCEEGTFSEMIATATMEKLFR